MLPLGLGWVIYFRVIGGKTQACKISPQMANYFFVRILASFLSLILVLHKYSLIVSI